MSKEDIHNIAYPLPPWASGYIKEKGYPIHAVLATRDGRATGNAIIFAKSKADWDKKLDVYHVITDAGNIVDYTEDELKVGFFTPIWIAEEPIKHLQPIIQEFMERC